MRFIGSLGYSRVILKGDREPSMCMLLEVVQQARQRLGFHTNLELVARQNPRAMEVEREGERDPNGERPCKNDSTWRAMRDAGWPLTHYRRQGGGPTAYMKPGQVESIAARLHLW